MSRQGSAALSVFTGVTNIGSKCSDCAVCQEFESLSALSLRNSVATALFGLSA